MSDAQTPVTRSLSPWWALLLLPVALLIGWFVGQTPAPKLQKPKAAEWQGGTRVTVRAESPRVVLQRVQPPLTELRGTGPAPTSSETEVRASDPIPTAAEKPASEPQPAEVSQWTTLENAMAESQRNGKPVMIDFNADWCGPCQALKKQVFENYTLGQAVQSAVIPVSIVDRRRELGQNPPEIDNLQRHFQVSAFPTLIVFSPATGRVMKTQGFGSADGAVAWITQAAKSVR